MKTGGMKRCARDEERWRWRRETIRKVEDVRWRLMAEIFRVELEFLAIQRRGKEKERNERRKERRKETTQSESRTALLNDSESPSEAPMKKTKR